MAKTNKEITEAWKRKAEKTWTIKLTSGLEVIVKRPGWISLLKMGLIPNRLFNLVMEQEVKVAKAVADNKKLDVDPKESAEIMQAYAVAACVVPKVVLEGAKADEINVGDIDDNDLVEIFTKVQGLLASGEEGEGQALETFREGKQSNNTGQPGPKVQHQAKPVTAHK